MAKKEIVYNTHTVAISYEMLNLSCEKTIVFLHGWGSNKEMMKQAFGNGFKGFKHLYIDLPGFGSSSIPAIFDTQAYANITALFLNALGIHPYAIFGHSFGGKVATLLSSQRLVLLSSAGIVPPKPLQTRLKIALFKSTKHFLPKHFYRFFASKDVEGMSQQMYEILKKVVNEDFREIFLTCKAKSYIFWGKDDRATPLKSGEIIASLIPENHFFPLEGDHFFFLKNAHRIEILLVESGFENV